MEKISRMIKDEQDINYDILKQIEQHAKEYDTTPNKKEFLKNVGAYEQKLILLNSSDPYEVLCYLEELDLPSTKLILSELSYDEISKILALFTSEDKKLFYTTFSDLDLVNHFIAYDKKAFNYIDDLSVDRKIDLLNSSNQETVLASSKVFDSISEEDKVEVVESITTADGMLALNNSSSYDDSILYNVNSNDSVNEAENNLEASEQEITEKNIENPEENTEEDIKESENNLDENLEEKMTYFKDNFERYKSENPELNNIDINDSSAFSLLSEVLLSKINADYQIYKNTNLKSEKVTDKPEEALGESGKLEEFREIQQQTEEELIRSIAIQLDSRPLELEEEKTENTKIL